VTHEERTVNHEGPPPTMRGLQREAPQPPPDPPRFSLADETALQAGSPPSQDRYVGGGAGPALKPRSLPTGRPSGPHHSAASPERATGVAVFDT
jgi:hypothetical protein